MYLRTKALASNRAGCSHWQGGCSFQSQSESPLMTLYIYMNLLFKILKKSQNMMENVVRTASKFKLWPLHRRFGWISQTKLFQIYLKLFFICQGGQYTYTRHLHQLYNSKDTMSEVLEVSQIYMTYRSEMDLIIFILFDVCVVIIHHQMFPLNLASLRFCYFWFFWPDKRNTWIWYIPLM